ncbi:MAG: hypothetical protein KF730_10020 [Sphingomonas sp.]|uniref:hypothetical protein n=1 Tax=Sphingomonas sp. TaxID=28214 RepID=UPI0025FAB87A|nr:hypothetical protein [Sphingomonas sp.]MBX3564898.1 hypothetical protein [Sphingomonas sp.]
MSLRGAITAVTLIGLPLPAIAQTAADALECKLPYRATMENAAKLKLVREGKPTNMVIATMTILELDPGTTRVYGLVPTRVSILMSEPIPGGADKPVSINFQSYFARTPANDKALLATVKWKQPCAWGSGLCYRETDPAGAGRLSIRADNREHYLVECEFKVREQDLK